MKITFDSKDLIENDYSTTVSDFTEYIKELKPYEKDCSFKNYNTQNRCECYFKIVTPNDNNFKWPNKPVKIINHKNNTITLEFNKIITEINTSFII